MIKFTDVAVARDAEGVYDLVIDESARDIAVTSGLETPLFCSLFSDRRAAPDEVADPMRRRGWIGDLVADQPGQTYGSGLWLYEQRRASESVRSELRMEVLQSLEWLVDAGLAAGIDAQVAYDPRRRRVQIDVEVRDRLGGVSVKSFELWQATVQGRLGTNQ
jgi:phage gp46-like protein